MTRTRAFPASIEMLPRQFKSTSNLNQLFPAGTRIYLTDIGTPETEAEMLAAACGLAAMGYKPVPHIAARRIQSKAALERRVAALANEAGVDSLLLIGGSLEKPAGPFESVMALLECGVFEANGIFELGVAGHPEGSPDFSDGVADAALLAKQDFAASRGINLHIVTQFAFDPDVVLEWAARIQAMGVSLPVHMGVAGPTGLVALIKYARLCGVGNSASLLTRQPKRLMGLGSGYSPEMIVAPVEKPMLAGPQHGIAQIHVFPFGGLDKAAAWLKERGSWGAQAKDMSV